MKARNILTSTAMALAALAGAGCAQDGTMTTQATPEKSITQSAAKTDPACATLASQIDTLRKEASIEGLEKAATGKSKSVDVRRSALAKQVELNKANADFQAKCGPAMPKAQTAQAAAPAAAQAVATPADAAKKTATGAVTATTPAAAKDAAQTAAKDAVKEAVKKAP